jgi:hypothetical protein
METDTQSSPILEYKTNISKKITKKDTVFLGKPNSEQDVIGLFVDLISKKVIRDIKFFTITGTGTYDFLLQLNNKLTSVGTKTMADIKKVHKLAALHDDYSKYEKTTIAEAKLHAASVIKEFQSVTKAKDIKECKLIVCWDIGEHLMTDWIKQRYTIKPMPKDFNKRIHPNETHLLQKKNNPNKEYVGIICLKEFFK